MTHHQLLRQQSRAAAGARWRQLIRRLCRVIWGRILACTPTAAAAGSAAITRPMRYHRIRACGCFFYGRGIEYDNDDGGECAAEAGPTTAAARVLLRRSADDDEVDDADLVTLKISLLGDCQIGKTTFMVKYVGDEEEQSGLQLRGLNLMDKILVVRGARIAFSIWDVGGDHKSLDHIPIACRDAAAILIMFDLTSRCTLINSISWYKRARKWNKSAIPILIGTKFDDFVQLPLEMQWTIVNQEELDGILKDYVGRESPLYFAERLTEHYKRPNGEGPHIYLKREDLNHTGAHKINNAVAQALLAKHLGKKRIIAETGAGQHGVATATVCARFGLQCVIYMGAEDMSRQALNVFRMRLLGGEVRPVHSGTATLKDATSEAIRDWVTNVETTHYILGSVAGPHPYPMMVRDFHAVIGKETRRQAMEKWGGKPDVLIACVGGGSNAMGLFHEFVDDKDVRLIGVEAAGHGIESGKHAATLTKGEVGVLHGAMSYLLQDDDGQIIEPHSISAGLDYPGVGPEHSFLKDLGRAEYYSITDQEALEVTPARGNRAIVKALAL